MWSQLADYFCCQVNTCVGRYVVYDDGNRALVRHGLVVLCQGSRLLTNSRSVYESARRGVKGKEMTIRAFYRQCVLQEAEDPRISGQSAYQGSKVVSPMHRPSLLSRIYSWYSFLLEAESTPGPKCGRKDYVNESFQGHHRESNPRPSGL